MKLLTSVLFAASTNATMTASEASLDDIKRYEPITKITVISIWIILNFISATLVQQQHPMPCSMETLLSVAFLTLTATLRTIIISSITSSLILQKK